MDIGSICALVIAAIFAWLGILCLVVGVCKYKKKRLIGPLSHEFILHQPAFGLVVSFCLTLVSEEYGAVAWIAVMAFTWYLIYALWALDSTDFERPRLIRPFLIPLFCLATCSVFWTLGFRLNATPSLPQGLYMERPMIENPVRGQLAGFCLPSDNPYSEVAGKRGYLKSGPCPNGLQPLLKNVAGLPGDHLIVTPTGITINGNLIPGSIRPERDSQDRDLPPSLLQSGPIPAGQVLVLATDHPGSFDSRHFGLVPLASLKKVKPIFTNNKEKEN